MLDVPCLMFRDPLIVHVLLLTHGLMYNNICLPHSWYPQCDSPCFSCAQNIQMMIPLFDLLRSVGPGRCLIDFAGFIQCCIATNNVVPFSPCLWVFFVSATKKTSQCVYNALHAHSLAVALVQPVSPELVREVDLGMKAMMPDQEEALMGV